MAVKSNFTTGDVLTASDVNTYLTNGGLVYVTSQTVGTGVSSVTISSAFSSTYDNYLVQYSGQMSILCTINTTLGASTTGYYNALQYTNYAAPGAGLIVNNNATGAFTYAGVGGTNYATYSIDLWGPFLAQPTKVRGPYTSSTDTGTFSGYHSAATSYSSFTATAIGGTFQGGTITVYGYRKA